MFNFIDFIFKFLYIMIVLTSAPPGGKICRFAFLWNGQDTVEYLNMHLNIYTWNWRENYFWKSAF